MIEDRCGSSVVCNIISDILLDGMVISVYNWNYLQVGLCAVTHYCSYVMDWYLGEIEGLLSSPRPSQMVLSRYWKSMAIIHAELDAMVQE